MIATSRYVVLYKRGYRVVVLQDYVTNVRIVLSLHWKFEHWMINTC